MSNYVVLSDAEKVTESAIGYSRGVIVYFVLIIIFGLIFIK